MGGCEDEYIGDWQRIWSKRKTKGTNRKETRKRLLFRSNCRYAGGITGSYSATGERNRKQAVIVKNQTTKSVVWFHGYIDIQKNYLLASNEKSSNKIG